MVSVRVELSNFIEDNIEGDWYKMDLQLTFYWEIEQQTIDISFHIKDQIDA